jgi:hypothetical protein
MICPDTAAEGEGEMRERRTWTPEEDERLRKMALSGTRPRDIAAALNRSRAAIQSRADKFGISLKLVKINRPGAATKTGLKAKR